MLRRALLFVVLVAGIWVGYEQSSRGPDGASPGTSVRGPRGATVPSSWQAGQQVSGEGIVTRVLPDDNEGSRHQRFILRLDSGRTLLVAHNIDLAARIDALDVGDSVAFHGEYEPNDRGGVIHWTHHDPRGVHPGGWLEHEGRRYE